MKPYYQDRYISIFYGDSREIVPQLGIMYDFIVYDPPLDKWKEVEVYPVSKSMAFTNPQNRKDTENKLGTPRIELVWHFPDGRWVSDNYPRLTHEYIYVYGETGNAFVGDKNANRKPIKKGTGSIGKDTTDREYYVPRENKQLNSVLIIPKVMNKDLGIWAKPPALMMQLLSFVEFDTVLDPYLGSGTTCFCAKKLNKKSIGIEIDEKSCELAARRCSQEVFEFDV